MRKQSGSKYVSVAAIAFALLLLVLRVHDSSAAANSPDSAPGQALTKLPVIPEGRSGESMVQFLRDWKEYVIAFIGLPFAAVLALLGARLKRHSDRKLLLEEQQGLLRALRGEISAVLYSLYYLSENISQSESEGRYLVRDEASYQGFPSSLPVYESNASRVGPTTARAYGMLATYYTKCRETVGRVQHEIRMGSVSKKSRDALFIEAGHGALIKTAFGAFQEGDLETKLSRISDDTFEESLKNFRSSEAGFFREGRALWIKHWTER